MLVEPHNLISNFHSRPAFLPQVLFSFLEHKDLVLELDAISSMAGQYCDATKATRVTNFFEYLLIVWLARICYICATLESKRRGL